MKTVYKRPERLGNKKSNPYCPGCMHSTVVRLVMEVLEELEVVDTTVMFPGIGCDGNGSFGYMDIDTVICPHGRALAVASAYKRCNPNNVVFTYQGDGDLAAIGCAETMHAANRGENLTVIFVNNAQYGMTGGQMAPTTLAGMKTTTTPYGRDPHTDGAPMHVCEILDTLNNPTFLARGTCTDPKNVIQTKKYIKKAFQNQIDGKGFSLVEIVSACPSNWGLSPIKSIDFINEKMLPEYPLGIVRDR